MLGHVAGFIPGKLTDKSETVAAPPPISFGPQGEEGGIWGGLHIGVINITISIFGALGRGTVPISSVWHRVARAVDRRDNRNINEQRATTENAIDPWGN